MYSSIPVVVKIPLLLATGYANYLTFTSPNPRSAPDEQSKYSTATYIVRQVRPPWVRALEKTMTQAFILLEIATIAATTLLPAPTAERVLPLLACRQLRVTAASLLGVALCVAGALLRRACYRAMGCHFTFELSLRRGHRLVTDGPYARVRHPSYAALIMVSAGTLLVLGGRGAWLAECALGGRLLALAWAVEVAWVPVVMVVRVGAEDEMLRREFGAEWLAWAERTPYKLIPGLF